MAGEEALFQSILQGGGLNRGSGYADITDFQNTVRSNDLYRLASAPLLSAKFDTSSWSPAEALGVTFGSSFLGGLLNAFGSMREADQLESVAGVLPKLYADPLSVELPEGVDKEAFGRLKMSALRERGLRTERDTDSRERFFTDIFSKNPGIAIATMPEMANKFGIKVPERVEGAEGAKPATAKALTDLGPDFGVEDLASMERRLTQENIASGMPAVQAATSARASVQDLRARSKSLIGEKLKEQADTIENIEKIIRTGEEGIAKAGVTGFPGSSTYEFMASFLPWASEAKEQVAGDQALKETQNLGAAINRIIGSGALSNMESKALFETAMSPGNTKEANEDILRRYKVGLAIAKEHNAFMTYFLDKTGGNPQLAQTMWEIYKTENPVFVQNDKKESVLNSSRTPWQNYDFVKGYTDYITGNPIIPSGGAAGGGVIPREAAIAEAKRRGLIKR